MKNTYTNVLAVTLMAVYLSISNIHGEEIANLANDFQKTNFPDGWSYLWNSEKELGESKYYTKLEPNEEDALVYYTPSGLSELPQKIGGYLFLGSYTSPGRVRGHAGSTSPFPHYAIFAYKLKTDGDYSITDSILINAAGASSTGLVVKVLVNDKEFISRSTEAGESQIDFDTKLGNLKVGDTVYVAVGPGEDNNSDLFDIQFILETN